MSSQILNSLPKFDTSAIQTFFKEYSASLSVPTFILNLIHGVEKGVKGHERLAGFLLIVFGTHLYYWKKYSFWSSRNVKGPRPVPIFGNFLTFMVKTPQTFQLEWTQKYGKVHGYYLGAKPWLMIGDADVLKQICIKDFDKFPNHYFVPVANKFQKHFLIIQKDDHWRGIRNIMTPTFTSGKIKHMYNLLDACAHDLIKQQWDRIDKLAGDSIVIDSRQTLSSFSMGSALTSFYGIDLEYSHEAAGEEKAYTKDGFAKRSREAFRPIPWRLFLSSIVPQNILIKLDFAMVREGPMRFFAENSRNIVERRKKALRSYPDYLQLLINAEAGSKVELAESDRAEEHHALSSDINFDNQARGEVDKFKKVLNSKMKLTDMELICQTMMLMLVATETTATLLSNTIYLLAYHQDIQERLYRDLVKIMIPKKNKKESNKFDYDQLTSCQYLDCVISETLRFLPPALGMDREASEDYYIEKYNIHVPKGTTIMLNYWSIHRDADYWPEPEKFDPERFNPENKHKIVKGSYCPFGVGPRSCIGFRFALTEAKLGIAKILSEFKIDSVEGTFYPPKPKMFSFILNESKDLRVKLTKRRFDV